MDNIIEPTMDYHFEKLQLGIPVAQPGSTYVSRLFLNNKPIYLQTPKCSTKGKFVKTGKKIHCDLLFKSDDSIFIDWMTHLEEKCQSLICSKSESWFQTAYTPDEIETAFSPPFKIYKSGKYYLLRVNVTPTMKIYNDLNTEVKLDDIDETMNMITIIEIYGIKFTSKNFQIEMELKQAMVVSPDEFLGNCFIKKNTPSQPVPILYEPHEPSYPPPQLIQEEQIALEIPVSLDKEEIDTNIIESQPPECIDNINININTNEAPENPIIDTNMDTEENLPTIEEELQNTIIDNVIVEIREDPPSLELLEVDFNVESECLEESTSLKLKRPNEQYYKEYSDYVFQASKMKMELNKIYLDARNLKEKYSLNVDDIENNRDTYFSDTDSDV
jgi:hypothetical protein